MKNLKNLGKSLNKSEQKEINGGFGPICPQFAPCWRDSDCQCGPCGVTIDLPNGGTFYIPDLCNF